MAEHKVTIGLTPPLKDSLGRTYQMPQPHCRTCGRMGPACSPAAAEMWKQVHEYAAPTRDLFPGGCEP